MHFTTKYFLKKLSFVMPNGSQIKLLNKVIWRAFKILILAKMFFQENKMISLNWQLQKF